MAALPSLGETIWGFTVTQLGSIPMLGAKTIEFVHEKSKARLLYIQNDDQELGCNLIYRTPQKDETDTNHILEHLVLSSCEAYPSRDIFFDMDSKSYSTFMNGVTDNTYTSYPLCTQSQEQLIKLMDVTLCCMESPDFLREPNFFLREGIRFELDSLTGPLTLQGTVLSEDWGHLTDIQENADRFTAKALYPGMEASNLLGKAHLHYKELNFRLVKEAFYRYYRYSNCLVVLYGDMELETMLKFLDTKHFSSEKNPEPEMGLEHTRRPAPGYRVFIGESPSYEGAPVDQDAIIDYAMDLSDSSQEELIYWDLFARLLDHHASPWHKHAKAQGLNNMMEAYLDLSLPLPSLRFRLRNGDAGQMELLKSSIYKGLEEIKSHGISSVLYQALLKESRLTDALTREASHLGYNISQEIGWYWSLTGKTDYFQVYQSAFQTFSLDHSQSILKKLAEKALTPKVSALVATLPKPGLAEKLEGERQQYLEDLFLSLSEESKETMVRETQKFKKWNSGDWGNTDFLIKPEALPLPPAPPSFQKKEEDFLTCYLSPAPVTGVGSYQLCFCLNHIPQEDLPYLPLYQMLLTELDTGSYTVEQQKTLEQEYLHQCTFDEFYPEEQEGAHKGPRMTVFWYGLTEDFSPGLDFLLHIMGDSDYNCPAPIIQAMEQYLPDYDLSKAENASSLAFNLAEGYIRREAGFRNMINSQENYYFLKDTLKRLKEDPTFGSILGETLQRISRQILRSPHVVFMAAASKEELSSIEEQGCSRLRQLTPLTDRSTPLPSSLPNSLPPGNHRLAVCVEAPSQEIRVLGDFSSGIGFKGRYLPFLLACGDKYLKPSIRYQGGAYDSGADFYIPAGYFSLWSTADPDIASTLDIFSKAGAAIQSLPLTQKELDGYILNAYAQALSPSKALGSRMRYMHRDMAGIDSEKVTLMTQDIRHARLEHQEEASRIIQTLLEQGPAVTVGNRRSILKHRTYFDTILDYRGNSSVQTEKG